MPGINVGHIIFSSTGHSADIAETFSSEIPTCSEDRYWKLNIIYTALETVLFSPSPNPKLTPEILKHLQTAFVDYGGVNIPTEESTVSTLITPEIKLILQTLVTREVKRLAESIAKTNSIILKSYRKDGLENVFRIIRFEESLDELYNIIGKRQKEEANLDQEIKQLSEVRQEEKAKLDNKLLEVKKDLEDLIRKASLHKEPEVVSRKLEYLKARSDVLTIQTDIAKKEQLIIENPPEIIAEMKQCKEMLATVKDELRASLNEKKAFLQKYESLTPDVLAIINELKNTETTIARQEWIKKELQGFNNPDESLTFF